MKTSALIIAIMISLASSAFSEDTFIISTSCGGGFAATHNVYSINQDGVVSRKVISYVIPGENKEEEIVGRIKNGDAKRLYMRLMALDFMNYNYNQPHNYSCSLILTLNAKLHSVTWPGFHTTRNENSQPPEEIKPVLDVFMEVSRLLAPIKDDMANRNK